jgi:hypothetical protein
LVSRIKKLNQIPANRLINDVNYLLNKFLHITKQNRKFDYR